MKPGWTMRRLSQAALAGAFLALQPGAAGAQATPLTPLTPVTPPAPGLPAWASEVTGRYAGAVRNAGRMECHITVFALRDGQLVGHYRIEDADPFEGELTGFVPSPPGTDGDSGAVSGSFTWSDRYGEGEEFIRFSADRNSFSGAWGTPAPELRNPVYGIRGGTAACEHAVS